MTCPFYIRTENGEICEVILEKHLNPSNKSASLVCHESWTNGCLLFHNLLESKPVKSNTSAEKKLSSPETWRLGHINRNGGLRSVLPDLF